MTSHPISDPSSLFGAELRRRRTAAGWSLGQFAKKIHYTKGYLSRVENGHQSPSATLAQQCDALLMADGELAALTRSPTPKSAMTVAGTDVHDGVWVLELRNDGGSMFHLLGRRDVLALGVASLSGMLVPASPPRSGNSLHQYRTLFDLTRQIGQTSSPALVLPQVITQVHALRCLLRDSGSTERTELAVLAARNAEYAGWMAQESGKPDAAIWWTRKSVDIAAEVGDESLAAYSFVRYALVAMYQRDAVSTVELAQQAQVNQRTSPRIRGLAAQREAQGHALAGEYTKCMLTLDRARELLASAAAQPNPGPVIGTSFVSDPVAVVNGWCLYDLGRPSEAAEVLDREVAHIPPDAVRSWTRFTARQALAHASAGNVERACELTSQFVDHLSVIDSETVRSDVRGIASVLRRWYRHPQVRDLDPILTRALRRPA